MPYEPPALFFLFGITLMLLNGALLFRLCRGFAALRQRRWAAPLLFITMALSSAMVIWIGDNNFAMTLPFFMAGFLAATQGDRLGRLTIASIFFCLIMSVCAMADTYLILLDELDLYTIGTRLARPVLFGLIVLLFHRRLPRESIQLPHHLWTLCAGLTSLPLAALAVLILPTHWMPESFLLHSLNLFQGLILLPTALVMALVLLRSILVLARYEQRAQAAALAESREIYYQGLRREQAQVRTLRHDLRNHLGAALGLLERDEAHKASQYLRELLDSPALCSSSQLCENEIANVVVSSKLREMESQGITADLRLSLPRSLPIADTDLCALLGNALDNALEATQRAEHKQILVRCKAEQGLFMLRVQNPLTGQEQPDLTTIKQDQGLHGFGLAGMREIAARYGGALEAGPSGSSFELLVSIPLS